MIQKHHPDKRTKAQMLRLLDNALHQEEKLVEKIQMLEAQLADCQKRAEDPRYEITQSALSSSKVSFRIDFYRTEKRGPIKGVIEHLSSRETRSFTGHEASMDVLQAFISKHLPIKARSKNPTAAPPSPFEEKATQTAASESVPPPGTPVISLADLPHARAVTAPEQQEESAPPPLLHDMPKPAVAFRPQPSAEGRLIDRIRKRLEMPEPAQATEQEGALAPSAPRLRDATVPLSAASGTDSIQVVAGGQVIQHRSLQHGQAFQIEVPALQLPEFQGKICQTRLTAENLETGEVLRLASAVTALPLQPLRLPQAGQCLEPGGYRLTALVSLQDDPKQVFFRESRLLVVNVEE